MRMRQGCGCGNLSYNVVFACSGAADLGALADRAARKLSRDKAAVMMCTAAIGASAEDILNKARNAKKLLVIDGCETECAKKVLERAGFGGLACLQLENLGLEKGKTSVDEALVEKVAARAAELINVTVT
ncbi:MAG: putative zinc-binding protein [Candidatus Glassbacteria bacterium]